MLARHALLVVAALPLLAGAQDGAEPDPQPVASATEEQGGPVTVAALTLVPVRIEETISSNKNKPGDRFRITVAEDVRVGDVVVIPMGSAGEGEVVHAAKSGVGGKAGELILAARFVHVGDVEVRLRSFTLGVVGKDHTKGSLAASMVVGPLAMFVKGGVVTVPAETLGLAKTASDFKLQAVVSPTPAPESQPVETTLGGEDEPKTE